MNAVAKRYITRVAALLERRPLSVREVASTLATSPYTARLILLAADYRRGKAPALAEREERALALGRCGLRYGGGRRFGRALGLAPQVALATLRSALAKRGELDLYETGAEETPQAARARVARELAAGVRCPRCHLLSPCNPDGLGCSAPTPASLARMRRATPP